EPRERRDPRPSFVRHRLGRQSGRAQASLPAAVLGSGRPGSTGAPHAVAFRTGFVAVVGRPGVGKSSLVNALVGAKVSIVSDKPQTTRFLVRGVSTTREHQIVFVDTPGLHRPRTALGERLNRRVHEGTDGVDALLMVVDGAGGVGSGDAFVAGREALRFAGGRVLAVNKIDLMDRPRIA